MKKVISLILIVISIITIYKLLRDDKIYYVSINGVNNENYNYSNYIVDYLDELEILEKYTEIKKDNRITDIIRNIENNIEYDNRNIQNILIKADLLTLSIGYKDIIAKVNKYNNYDMYKYIETYISDLDKLFILLRKYDKETIIMIGYNNPFGSEYDKIIDYINDDVKTLCSKYNIEFIDIKDTNSYLDNEYLTIEGEHIIFNKLRYLVDMVIKKNK